MENNHHLQIAIHVTHRERTINRMSRTFPKGKGAYILKRACPDVAYLQARRCVSLSTRKCLDAYTKTSVSLVRYHQNAQNYVNASSGRRLIPLAFLVAVIHFERRWWTRKRPRSYIDKKSLINFARNLK